MRITIVGAGFCGTALVDALACRILDAVRDPDEKAETVTSKR